ncbi:MAG: acyl-ACP--UDP-N-acetylglucosamine O-acyltransferase [Epsilonproteobacteria bacterium]|nr:acyl-ACP--UDP-N-acetylglucosamine O-acyltransferase [Campylobacterota bacterium]
MSKIHNTAIIEKGAVIGEDVEIGPYAFISSQAKIANGVKIMQGAQIHGDTEIGEKSSIFYNAVIGSIPQDLKYRGEKVKLIIGKNNKIREFTFLNPGTEGGGGVTKIGDNNLIMGYVHIAHDCIIGDNNIFANAVTLAGHVEIGNNAVIGGMTPVHQFVKIGDFAMIGGASAVAQDIPPYCLAEGNRAVVKGLNLVGLRRHFERKEIDILKRAFKEIFLSGKSISEAARELLQKSDNDKVRNLCNFILNTKRGIPFERKKDK